MSRIFRRGTADTFADGSAAAPGDLEVEDGRTGPSGHGEPANGHLDLAQAAQDEDDEDALPAPLSVADVDIDPDGQRLGELLVGRGLIGREEVGEAILRQQGDQQLGTLLVELGLIGEEALVEVLAYQAGASVLSVREVDPDPAAVERLAETSARTLGAVPFRIADDGVVEVGVSDASESTRQALEQAIGSEVRLYLATPAAIGQLLDSTYRAIEYVAQIVERFEAADTIRRAADAIADDAAVDDAPVVQVVNLLITQALHDRASDIHVEPQGTRVRLRYRIDGALHDVLSLPAAMALPLVSRLKIMAGLNIVERRRPQDGQISMTVEGRELDIRVAVAPTIWGEKVALRLLDKSRALFQLTDLGMSTETEQRYTELVHSPFGMVICAGPTGSGKTTTLYATLLALEDDERNITTIEDPVEYVLPAINQMQINPAADLTFVSGLRSILRQDPDLILVGEIRDTETARIAVRSALTGHLVLSSIHSTDATSALQRFVDMGVEPYLVTSSIVAVVAQRLVRRICTYCKVSYFPSADELSFYRSAGGPEKTLFAKGEGCNFCAHTGYQERIGVYELLVLSEDIRELVLAGASRDQIREVASVQHGMRTLRQEGIRLVSEDVTTVAEVIRHIWTM